MDSSCSIVETTSNVHTSIYIILCLCVPLKGYVLAFEAYSAFYWQCLFGCAAYGALLGAGRQECSSWGFFFQSRSWSAEWLWKYFNVQWRGLFSILSVGLVFKVEAV